MGRMLLSGVVQTQGVGEITLLDGKGSGSLYFMLQLEAELSPQYYSCFNKFKFKFMIYCLPVHKRFSDHVQTLSYH
jgi:hypothetical protein